jgi:hypothetical protein
MWCYCLVSGSAISYSDSRSEVTAPFSVNKSQGLPEVIVHPKPMWGEKYRVTVCHTHKPTAKQNPGTDFNKGLDVHPVYWIAFIDLKIIIKIDSTCLFNRDIHM